MQLSAVMEKKIAKEISLKFPKSITRNPCFEEASPSTPKDKSDDYIAKQKEDFLNAIQYAEDNILTQPIDSWTTDFVLKHLENLYKLCAKTLLTHPVSHLRISSLEFEKTNFRTVDVYFTKEVPKIADTPPNFKFNLDYPVDIFSILYKAYGNEVAFNFIKWYIKWHPMTEGALKDLSSKLKHLTLHYNQLTPLPPECIIMALFHKHFEGKEIQGWVKTELEKNPKFSFPKDLQSFLNINLRARINLPGLYSPEEEAARDRVLKYFPTVDEIPKRMAELIKNIIDMIQKKSDPITIACRFHHEMVNVIHPYYNANHRLARMMMNIILMSYGLPALEFDVSLRKKYNQVSDQGYIPLERFIRKRIHDLQVNQYCLFARDGDLAGVKKLSSMGIDPNLSLATAKKWTPLHYACKVGHMDVAKFLIAAGASIAVKNDNGKTPLDFLKPDEQAVLKACVKPKS